MNNRNLNLKLKKLFFKLLLYYIEIINKIKKFYLDSKII